MSNILFYYLGLNCKTASGMAATSYNPREKIIQVKLSEGKTVFLLLQFAPVMSLMSSRFHFTSLSLSLPSLGLA